MAGAAEVIVNPDDARTGTDSFNAYVIELSSKILQQADFERGGVAKLTAEPGHEVYTIAPAQLDEWRKAAEPVVKIWADAARKVGVDPDVALAELKASVQKYNALE